jgi:hypothetical protein
MSKLFSLEARCRLPRWPNYVSQPDNRCRLEFQAAKTRLNISGSSNKFQQPA